MRILAKFGVLCAVLSASTIGLVAVANADHQPEMVATPFITDTSPQSKNFLSSVVSTGKRNPFAVTTNSSNVPQGSYSGVVVTSENATRRGIDNLSFAYKATKPVEAVVEFTTPGRQQQRAFARYNPTPTNGDFAKVVLSKEQLGIPKDSSWNKIVMTQSALGSKGRFQVDEIAVDGNPVRKAMKTAFFNIGGLFGGGPLGPVGAAAPQAGATSLIVKNGTPAPVQIYMQLQPIQGCSAPLDVKQVYPAMNYAFSNNTTLGVIQVGALGTLNTSYNGPLSANFSAVAFNQLCPTNLYQNGIALAEVTLNNQCQGQFAQETLDISLVNGLNAIFNFDISGTAFQTVTNTAANPPTIAMVNSFSNRNLFSQNFNLPGVFPYGCTNCSNNDGVSVCPPPGLPQPPSTGWDQTPPPYGACNPTTFQGCNLSRSAASASGGTVTITYKGPAQGVSAGTTLLQLIRRPR